MGRRRQPGRRRAAREVRRWILDRALGWFRDFHLDALRLDAVHELHDDVARPLLAQLSDETAALRQSLGRPLALVAETDLNDPRDDRADQLTAAWA